MRQHHFVAISGPRNTGKSRICKELKRGLESEVRNMREVERRFKAKAGMKWKVAHIKLTREDNPFDLVTQAIADSGSNILVSSNEKVDPLFENKIKRVLKRENHSGLIWVYEKFLKPRGYNFLLIVDQFENLFFSTILSQEEKLLFIRMLLHASLHKRQIYVLAAIRPPKADLWKTNFKELNQAVNLCRFRLYNPNQRELEGVIDQAFQIEKSRILGNDLSDELLSPEWLMQQDIYQRVAIPKIRNISEDMAEVMKTKWKKMLKETSPNTNSRMVAASSVKHITKELKSITETIWPQLLIASKIGNLAEEDRDDIIIDLKAQMTDVLTSELLHRMSKHLAEELYFEREPLTQIEKHVRQLVRDWADATSEIRSEQEGRRSRIKTVFLAEQKSTGAAFGDTKIDLSLPLSERAESAYNALQTTLDKRIAKKVMIIMGRSANASEAPKMTVDSLGYAIGRFSSRINDVLAVFIMAGILIQDPKGDLKPNTKIEISDLDIVEKWPRLKEWVFGLSPGSGKSTSPDSATYSTDLGDGAPPAEALAEIDLSLKEDFGDVPQEAKELVHRAESVYASLAPVMRKRVAKRLMVYVAQKAGADGSIKTSEIKSGIGRFQSQLDELIEYFVRQGILKFSGPAVGFSDPAIFNTWSDLQGWLKE